MALLESIRGPEDVRRLERAQLQPLADEVRTRLIDVVSQTGGHIGAGLGVVELTVALCYCFDSPRDKIVWDVGHQAYPWKILDRKSTRLNSSHLVISYAVFCLKKKKIGIEVQDRAAGDKVFAAELAE